MNTYFNKWSVKDFNVYKDETFNNLSIEYYIVAFIILFSLKEINSRDKTLKFVSLGFVVFCAFLEFSFYNFYDLQKYIPF